MKRSFLAGMAISIGGTAFLSVGGGLIGAVLFSIALVTIIEMDFHLYTGKICFADFDSIPYIVAVVLLGNISACLLFGTITAAICPQLITVARSVCQNKLSEGIRVLALGAMCNILIYFAVTIKKVSVTMLCVVVFIMCGFEHCIANTFYFAVAGYWNFKSVTYLAVNIVGSSVGGIVVHRLCKHGVGGTF